jgi:hypothetical protein
VTTWRAPVARTAAQKQRRAIRSQAAAIAAITAVMHMLTGFADLGAFRPPERMDDLTD